MKSRNTFRKRILAFITPSLAYAEETPQESGLVKAIDWLKQNQKTDGSWGIDDKAFVATSEVAGYLEKNNLLPDNLQKTVTWTENLEILNNDI